MGGDGFFERRSRRSAVLGLVTVLAIAGAILFFALDDRDQRQVTVQAGNALPEPRAIDREDEHGADTVRAFLQGLANCDEAGGELAARMLAQQGAGIYASADGCTGEVTARWVGDGRWRVDGLGLDTLRVARGDDGAWAIVAVENR